MEELIRFIHPLGQGAFYTEHFIEQNKHINIVYDCGCEMSATLKGRPKRLIESSFSSQDIIDILFISHLDLDHINGIDTLKTKVKHIRYVVMPLLTDLTFAIDFAQIVDWTSPQKKLLENPVGYFNPSDNNEEKTRVIFVEPYDEKDQEHTYPENIDISNLFRNISDLSRTIPSGTRLRYINPDWLYIPYNYKFPDRKTELLKKLKNAGIPVSAKDIMNNPKWLKKVKEFYKELDGTINENSMVVLSTPDHDKQCRIELYPYGEYEDLFFWRWQEVHHRPACLYTGDSSLPLICKSLKKELRQYLDFLGLIQIPHHGSNADFSTEIFNLSPAPVIYFLSHGINNSYGHPSHSVLLEMAKSNQILFCVNENPQTRLIQMIRFHH